MTGVGDPEIAFILLSFKRPWNMRRVLEPILALELPKRILISNNNAAIDLIPYLPGDTGCIELIQQRRNCLAVKRFELARTIRSPCYLCVDDDIFLTRDQIDALLQEYRRDTSTPQGIWGQVLLQRDGQWVLKGGFRNLRRRVDVLNRVYVFSSEHLVRYFQLLERLGCRDPEDLGHADDIVLSFCGERAPLIHDLGAYRSCHSDSASGYALWKEQGFSENRLKIFERLSRITGRAGCASPSFPP